MNIEYDDDQIDIDEFDLSSCDVSINYLGEVRHRCSNIGNIGNLEKIKNRELLINDKIASSEIFLKEIQKTTREIWENVVFREVNNGKLTSLKYLDDNDYEKFHEMFINSNDNLREIKNELNNLHREKYSFSFT